MKYKLNMQPDDVLKAIESIQYGRKFLMTLSGHVKMGLDQMLSFFIDVLILQLKMVQQL